MKINLLESIGYLIDLIACEVFVVTSHYLILLVVRRFIKHIRRINYNYKNETITTGETNQVNDDIYSKNNDYFDSHFDLKILILVLFLSGMIVVFHKLLR